MTTVILDAFFEKSTNKDDDGVYRCFTCRTEVPEHLIACWNCGQVLSENIRKLTNNK